MDYNKMALICEKYYDEKTLAHVNRVMHKIQSYQNLMPQEIYDIAIQLAAAHDLIEDTDCPFELFYIDNDLREGLELITRKSTDSYFDYIKRIKHFAVVCGFPAEVAAWWVKIADIKDHLEQKETLTNSLKKRYLKALDILL